MRQQDDVGQARERVVRRQRLAFEHVQRRPRDASARQRVRQRCLVHHLSARGVDQVSAAFHQRELTHAHQTTRFFREVHVQRHEVGLPQQLVQRHRPAQPTVILADHVVVPHPHIESSSSLRDTAPDAPQADDAQRLPLNVASQPHRMARPPLAAAHEALRLRQPPRQREHQRHRQVGDRIAQDARRVAHQYATLAGERQIDVVEADTEVRYHPQAWRRFQDLPVDLEHRAAEQPVHASQRGAQLLLRGQIRAFEAAHGTRGGDPCQRLLRYGQGKIDAR